MLSASKPSETSRRKTVWLLRVTLVFLYSNWKKNSQEAMDMVVYYGFRYRCCIDSKLGSFEIYILSFQIHRHEGLASRSCVSKVCDALKETTEER